VNDTLRKIIEDTLLLAVNTDPEDDETQGALVHIAARLCAALDLGVRPDVWCPSDLQDYFWQALLDHYSGKASA